MDPSLHTPRNNSHGINLGSNPKKELELSKQNSWQNSKCLARSILIKNYLKFLPIPKGPTYIGHHRCPYMWVGLIFWRTNIVDPSLHTPRNNSHGINLGSNPKKELELSKTPSYYLQMHLANFCSVFKQTLPPLRPRVYIMRKYTQQLVI